MDLQELKKHLFVLSGEDAIWHLYRVSSGLDSLVVGEGQILAQVKRASYNGLKPDGHSGRVLNRLLNTAVSVSSAAIEFAASLYDKQSHLKFEHMHVVIIGAGKMARLLLVHLKSKGCGKITIVNRSPEKMKELSKEFKSLNITCVGLDHMWESLAAADLVYPSTASKCAIINKQELQTCMAARAGQGKQQGDPLVFVDISVPRNVHEDCEGVDGVRVFNVDDLKSIVQRNTATRKQEMRAAEVILTHEMEQFSGWLGALAVVPEIVQLRGRAAEAGERHMARVGRRCKNLSQSQLRVIDQSSRAALASLVHLPIATMKNSSGRARGM